MTHLVIRADGGPDIGYGHLVRTGSVGEKLLSRDVTVTYATVTPEHVREVCPSPVEVTRLQSRSDPGQFLEWVDANEPDAVLTDAYPVDTAYQRTVRERAPLMVVQDDDRHAICADIFTNGNVYAEELQYEFAGPEPRLLFGTDYILLRDEIAALTTSEPPTRNPPKRALITMGGSDIDHLTPQVVRAFDGTDLRVDAIVGPGFSAAQESAVHDAASELTTDVRVVRDPDDLPERMFDADLAVCTASSTTYEFLALGTPVVAIPQAPNQERIADALEKRDMAVALPEDPSVSDIRSAVESYKSNSILRQKRQSKGKRLIDGRGAERITEEILSLMGESDRL